MQKAFQYVIFIFLIIYLSIFMVNAGLSVRLYDRYYDDYASCVVSSGRDYELTDPINKSAISFSLENNEIMNLKLCAPCLFNETNKTNIEKYINYLYDLPTNKNLPDTKEKLINAIQEKTNLFISNPDSEVFGGKIKKPTFDLLNSSSYRASKVTDFDDFLNDSSYRASKVTDFDDFLNDSSYRVSKVTDFDDFLNDSSYRASKLIDFDNF